MVLEGVITSLTFSNILKLHLILHRHELKWHKIDIIHYLFTDILMWEGELELLDRSV
jgi:hypothetical protein